MREIKFRGKCIPEFPHPVAKWVYGSFVSDELILSPYKERNENRHFWYMVDPDTVGQFTGLLDADGREIYEGDIVRFKEAYKGALGDERVHDVVGVVSYVYCEFKIVSDGTSELWAPCLMDGVTVIGNVHDTPELLEDKDA